MSARSAFWRATRAGLLATPLRRSLLHAPQLRGTAAYLATRVAEGDVLLHGAHDPAIEEFSPRPQTDFDGNLTNAVFATDDAIWAIFFAVVNRRAARSLVNACVRVRGESRYFFSISACAQDPASWRDGWVYVVPRRTFSRHPSGPEWLSATPVQPLDRVPVTPSDFPLLDDVVSHRQGEALPRIVARATILRRWAR